MDKNNSSTMQTATISRGVPVLQKALDKNEVFTPHPTDPTKLLAHYCIENPYASGLFYKRTDEIPVVDQTAKPPSNALYYFSPDRASAKIPPRTRANKKNNRQATVWTYQPTRDQWKRSSGPSQPDEVWAPVVIFRRFNAVTHEYMEAYTSIAKLKDTNPNDKKYMYAYNKWIDQIRRRRDSNYNKVFHKDHWSVAERHALYTAINAFVHMSGLHKFGFGQDMRLGAKDLQTMADVVNKAGGNSRQVDAIRGQIVSAHAKKNKPIFDLLQRAKVLRDRLSRNENVTRAERYPVEAILPSLFPVEPTGETDENDGEKEGRNKNGKNEKIKNSVKAKAKGKGQGKKKGEGNGKEKVKSCAIIADDDSELSDVPSGLSPPPTANLPLPDKQVDIPILDTTNDDDPWKDTDEEVRTSELEALEEMDWETCSDWTERDSDKEQHVQEFKEKKAEKGINPVHLGFIQSKQEKTSSITRSTPPKKRKRMSEAIEECNNSDADDESEMPTPQVRKVKKMRMSPREKMRRG